jgi:hypothetical protein
MHRISLVAVLCISATLPVDLVQAQAPAVERVTMEPKGAAPIVAEYRHAGTDAPGVLLFPMCARGAMQGWTPVADDLRSRGVSSLVLTYTWAREAWTANADAAVAYLRSRSGGAPPLAVAGSSCGVDMGLSTAAARPDAFRAVVALTGPHNDTQVAFIRRSPGIAVYAACAEQDGPAAGWARELRGVSAHADSTLVFVPGSGHGTELFGVDPSLAPRIADWLAARLRAR